METTFIPHEQPRTSAGWRVARRFVLASAALSIGMIVWIVCSACLHGRCPAPPASELEIIDRNPPKPTELGTSFNYGEIRGSNSSGFSAPVTKTTNMAATDHSAFCNAIGAEHLYKGCTCAATRGKGGVIDCKLTLPIVKKTEDMKIDLEPCKMPAYATLQATPPGTTFKLEADGKNRKAELTHVDIPVVGTGAVYLNYHIAGDASQLAVQIGVNLCSTIFGMKVCGDDIPGVSHFFPISILNKKYQFDTFCDARFV
jgi:hypothetical protein